MVSLLFEESKGSTGGQEANHPNQVDLSHHHGLRVFREGELGSWVRHKTLPVWVQEGGTGKGLPLTDRNVFSHRRQT